MASSKDETEQQRDARLAARRTANAKVLRKRQYGIVAGSVLALGILGAIATIVLANIG